MQRKHFQLIDSPEHQQFMKEVNFAIYANELRQIPASDYHKAAEDYALYGTLYQTHQRKPQTYMNGSHHHKEGRKSLFTNNYYSGANYRTYKNYNYKQSNRRASNRTKKSMQTPFSFQSDYSSFIFSQFLSGGISVGTQYPHQMSHPNSFNQLPMYHSNSVIMYPVLGLNCSPLSVLMCHWYCPFQMVYLNSSQYYGRNFQTMQMQNCYWN